jgi:pimeloyl-ACP methyl ester carboxylesterase
VGEFPQGFKVPLDQGGPGYDEVPPAQRPKKIGGFGGDSSKDQSAHRAAVQSAGRTPIVLVHGNAASADIAGDEWSMETLRTILLSNGYPKELIWAPSYLGTSASRLDDGGFGPKPPTPHANNVNEVREFIDNVCEYMGVDFVDIIAHSLGCTLAYSVFRGLSKLGTFDESKKWNRVGTFVALDGGFRGLTSHTKGEWFPNGEFINELRKEDPSIGDGSETPYGNGKPKTPGPSPHNITYFCGVADGSAIDVQSPAGRLRTGFLEGAINEKENLGSGWAAHKAIIKAEKKFYEKFLPYLNRERPVPPVTITVDKESGNHHSPLAITLNIEPVNKTVNYVAKRITKEFAGGLIGDRVAETLEGTLNNGQALTLSTNGMWEIVFSADGAEDLKRTYGVGIELIEVAIVTDNSTPFEGSLNVMATATRGKLYHSDDELPPQMWIEGANITITENKCIRFIAIDSDGTASEIVKRCFTSRPSCDDATTANALEHFLAGRIDANEFVTYSQQFGGSFQPFTLCLLNGDWVLATDQPVENPLPPTVTVSPDSGTYTEAITVTLSARDKVDPSPIIFYTLDGSTPMTNSPFFVSSGQITFDVSGTKTLKYFAQNSSSKQSDVETKTYEMNITDARAVIKVKDGDPQPGEYSAALTVTIEAVDRNDEHVTVHYTLDGSMPDENSPSFEGSKEFGLSGNGNHAIACYAIDSGGNETREIFHYSLDDQKYPETGIAPSRGGTYAGGVEITLTPSEQVEWTKYTVDDSVPGDDTGIPYTEPFTLTETTALKWRSKDAQGNIEPVNTAVFAITKELQAAVFGSDISKDGYIGANADGSRRLVGTLGSLPLGVRWDGKLDRAILHFDTASIPDNATITKARLQVKYFGGWADPWAGGNQLVVDVKTGYFGNSLSLQTGDWDSPATAEAVARIEKFTGGTKDSDQFSQGGLDAINKVGVTQVRLRFDPDPSGTPRYVYIKQGADIKLFVEYAI